MGYYCTKCDEYFSSPYYCHHKYNPEAPILNGEIMTKGEAINHIMAKSGDWISEKITNEEFFEIIESYVKMVQMTDTKPANVVCPECGGEMVSRKGKYGVFWGCKKYPKCNGTRDSEGKSREDRDRERAEKANVEPIDEKFRFRKG